MKRAVLSIAILGFSACGAHASILSVDLNGARTTDMPPTVGTTYTGNGVLRADGSTNNNPTMGTPTGHWDGVTFPTSPSDPNSPSQTSGFLDSSSQPTSVTIALANWAFQDNCPGCNYSASNQTLLDDYIGRQYETVPPGPPPGTVFPTLTIGGLNANEAFTLIIYGTNGGSTAGGTWSVNGSPTQQTTGSGPGTFTTYSNGNDYVKFNVSSNALGQLVVTGSPGPINNGYVILNGFQLSPAPGPASLSLLGIGALGLLARRRRA